MKKIAINGRFLSQAITGVQRYAHELLRELDQLLLELPRPPEVEVIAPSNAKEIADFKFLRVRRVGRLTGQAWEQFELPLYCRGCLLFTPCGGAPLVHDSHVITIHDAAVFATPHAYSLAYGTWYRGIHRRLCDRALHVFTVSEFSRSELIKWCGADPSKVSVTYLGADHVLRDETDTTILDQHNLAGAAFVLAVSSKNPNKNFPGIVQASRLLQSLNVRFVIVGGLNAQIFRNSPPLPESISEVGYVTDGQLRAFYKKARCFVFPSFYEGFGLPPLEAMSSACPVVASNIAALRETCGDGALYCDPGNPASIAEQIETLLLDDAKRSSLVGKGSDRARTFRWKKTAEATWRILHSIAGATKEPVAPALAPSTQDNS